MVAHVHALLGALVLFDFARRAWLTATTGDAGVDGGLGTLAWIGVHGLLHLTSFRFALACRRSRRARWHAAIFAARSLVVLLAMWLASDHDGRFEPLRRAADKLARCVACEPDGGACECRARLLLRSCSLVIQPTPAASVAANALARALRALAGALEAALPRCRPDAGALAATRFVAVIGAMLLADLAAGRAVTAARRDAAEGAARGYPYPDGTPAAVRAALNAFYSLSQVGGTLVVLGSGSMAAVLFVLLPIETAPLLATLVKKGVLRLTGWHLWHALSIAAATAFAAARTPAAPLTWAQSAALVATFGVLRSAIDVNKYVLWNAVGAVIAAASRRAP
jgi:hypothetical protein